MAKKRIVSALLTLVLTTPLIQVQAIQINSKPEQSAVKGESLDFRNYKIRQLEEIARVQIQKRKEIELQKQKEEELRAIEEQNKVPHFNPYDVSELSNLDKDQIHKMLEGSSLVTLVDALYWYEQEYNVNLIFITSIVALESGWGRSSLAISHNNLTGYIGQNGEYYSFNSWGDSLQETFRLIGEEYVSQDGLFYNGTSVWNINQKYCEVDSWSGKVISIGNELLNKIN